MKRKPIKLNWDDLDAAFSKQNDELVYYLDLVTGYVVLEGEGDPDDSEDEEAYSTGSLLPAPPRDDSTRIYISPPDDAQKVVWMAQFVDEKQDLDGDFADELRAALTAEDAVPVINDVLRRHPEGRDHWYLYRSECKHRKIEEWLEEHSIETADPSPWKV